MKTLICSFFGHRKININNNLNQKIYLCIENLIVNYNVKMFLFGSKSDFNDYCHFVVSGLKQKYSNIKRVCYTCKSEGCALESQRQEYETFYLRYVNKEVYLLTFEEEHEHKTKYTANKASYVKRNQAMIDDSDICVFYYNKNYVPSSKTKSGTKIAFEYAIKKKKCIINLFN